MTEYEVRAVSYVIAPKGAGINDERATLIELSDEGGGEFIEVTQAGGGIRFDKDEWPWIRERIEVVMKSVRDD
jgi:hypothetical protein